MEIDPSAPSFGDLEGETGLAITWCLSVRGIAGVCQAYSHDYRCRLQGSPTS